MLLRFHYALADIDRPPHSVKAIETPIPVSFSSLAFD